MGIVLPFRPIPQGQDELQKNEGQINVFTHSIDDCISVS